MEKYHNLAKEILTSPWTGYKPNRTAIDSISRFGPQMEFDLREGFPLLTTKKIFTESVTHELLWMLKGDHNIKYLVDNGVNIWNEWAFQRYLALGKKLTAEEFPSYTPEWREEFKRYVKRIRKDDIFAAEWGELGPVYGKQWRKWLSADGRTVDQLQEVIVRIRDVPYDRRHIVSAWNPGEKEQMALPPCHAFYQMNVQDDRLDLKMYQRSADTFLGVPFNIASYAMLTEIIAKETGLTPGAFVHTFGDAHFYCGHGARGAFYGEHLEELKERVRAVDTREGYLDVKNWIKETAPEEEKGYEQQDHLPLVLEQLSREPRQLPKLRIEGDDPFDQILYDNIHFDGYNPHPPIRGGIAV